MTNNSKNVAKALRIYAECAKDDFDVFDGDVIYSDMHILADALKSEREITLDYLLKKLYIEERGGSYQWA